MSDPYTVDRIVIYDRSTGCTILDTDDCPDVEHADGTIVIEFNIDIGIDESLGHH